MCSKVFARFDHPLSITTKSDLVCRDIDILRPMDAKGLIGVALSVTTLDDTLARTMEPRCPTPQKRLAAIKALNDAGIPVAVMVAPVIPGLNDHEIEDILGAAKKAEATAVEYILLRLPLEIYELLKNGLRRISRTVHAV